jgi:LEA14-like dessication related protein
MFKWINNKIRQYIIKKASEQRSVDIIEVKVKEIGLLSVKSETRIRFENTFFLPIEIISIKTELYNGTVEVGEMNYETPQVIPKKSFIEITTISEISIITSFFQMLSNLLAQPISLRSVGIARLKILWWEVEIPIDDTFKILPHQLKVKKEETEEEKEQRLIQEEARRIKRMEKRLTKRRPF